MYSLCMGVILTSLKVLSMGLYTLSLSLSGPHLKKAALAMKYFWAITFCLMFLHDPYQIHFSDIISRNCKEPCWNKPKECC